MYANISTSIHKTVERSHDYYVSELITPMGFRTNRGSCDFWSLADLTLATPSTATYYQTRWTTQSDLDSPPPPTHTHTHTHTRVSREFRGIASAPETDAGKTGRLSLTLRGTNTSFCFSLHAAKSRSSVASFQLLMSSSKCFGIKTVMTFR